MLTIGSGATLDIEKGPAMLATGTPDATLDGVAVTGTDAVPDTSPASVIDIGVTSMATTTLVLDDGATITHGSMTIGTYGVLEIAYGTSGTGATLDDISITNSGTIQIDSGAALTLEGAVTVTGDSIGFAATTGTLVLDNPSSFTGAISGISGSGDILDLKGFDAANDTVQAATGANSYNSATNLTTLTVTDSDGASVQLSLVGDYSGSSWQVTTDTNGGADIVDLTTAMAIAVAGTLELSSPGAPGEGVSFLGSTGFLTLDYPSSFAGLISGFTGDGTLTGSDQIDLKGIDYHSSSFTESFNAATDTLSVSDGAQRHASL